MITLVNYKAGNLTSVKRALDHLGIPAQISADPDVVRRADKLIFPGVGAAGAAMDVLRERGLDSALKDAFTSGTSNASSAVSIFGADVTSTAMSLSDARAKSPMCGLPKLLVFGNSMGAPDKHK